MNFDELGLSPKVLAAIKAAGYETPTPIQERAIPVALSGRDVLGIAQTGTGKTGAFVLPMLTRLEKGRARARMPRMLIIEPTRELAAQVVDALNLLGSQHKLTVSLLIGGVSFDEQDRKLDRGADVVIATPGRLLDHFERGKLLLTGVELLVIDEADRMLDMGFIPDVERICKLLPFTRQTLFFSATMPPEIQRLVSAFLHNPERIEVARPASTATNVTQRLVAVSNEPKDKRATLRELIKGAEGLKNAIVFCNRKRDVATLFRSLQRHGFNAGALHGDMDQHARMATLDQFRSGELTLLVASDVAARGLDIPEVSHVFNFDVPTHAEDYVHRIGRTGRAGRSGMAMTLVTRSERKYLDSIEGLIQTQLEWHGDQPQPAEDGETAGGRKARTPRKRGKAGETKPQRPNAAAGKEKTDDKQQRPARASKAPARAPDQPVTPDQHVQRNKPRRDHNEDGRTPVGLGDHVPAFLLRPARLDRS